MSRLSPSVFAADGGDRALDRADLPPPSPLPPSRSIRTRLTLLKKASTTEYIQPKDVESIYHAVLKQG